MDIEYGCLQKNGIAWNLASEVENFSAFSFQQINVILIMKMVVYWIWFIEANSLDCHVIICFYL